MIPEAQSDRPNYTKKSSFLFTTAATPPKTKMEPENEPWKRRFLLETIIFRFHVSFWGGISSETFATTWQEKRGNYVCYKSIHLDTVFHKIM